MIKGLEHLSQKERLRGGTVQPGEEEAHRDLLHLHKYLMEGEKKMEPDSFQCCPVRGQEAMGTN